MEPARKLEIEAMFEASLARPASARRAWLDEACGQDEALHGAVLRLLRAHERAEGILDSPLRDATRLLEEVGRGSAPDRIGPYRLIRELGRGGMSTVYLAERDDDQYRQAVAVKVVRRELEDPDLVERFVAERQILASLSHPNIARLLDGGATEDGSPYLVIEYVDGEPVTEYCDRKRLTIDQRLRLFLVIANAVQHAHRSFVVHRDLKPGNILVTREGEIKLLDFGIAKLLDPHGLPATLPQTRPGLQFLTPEYASPEQIRGDAITTATDVYGLGLVLYELLAGSHPFKALPGSERRDARQRPSVPRVSSAVARKAEISDARGTHYERLRRDLRGDLDRIVATALRDDPEQRYASVDQLADDIERHLQRRPIRARTHSLSYRTGRFVARHRWGVAATAGFLLLLSGYVATVTVKERQVRSALERANAEAERAEQVASFLMQLFEAPGAGADGTDALTASELLARGAVRAEQFSDQPLSQAQMLEVIGRTYQYLGQFDRAEPLLERALNVRRGVVGDVHPSVAESLFHLARLHHDRGRLAVADTLLRQALHAQRRLLGGEHPQVGRSLARLALVTQDRGEYEQAETLAAEALELRRRLFGSDHPEVAESLNDLAEILRRQGDYAGAEPLHREALALRRKLFGDRHPHVAESLHNLAYVLQLKGDLTPVESLYRQALTIHRDLWGEEHPALAATTSNLGLLMFRNGDLDAADSLYRDALAMRRRVLGKEHPDVAISLGLLAALERRRGQHARAEELYRESLAMQRRVLGGEHPDMAHNLSGLALVLRDLGHHEAADSLYRKVIDVRVRLLGDRHPAVAMAINDRGMLMLEMGDFGVAESLLLRALEIRRDRFGPDHPHIQRSLRNLVTLYERMNRPEEALAFQAEFED